MVAAPVMTAGGPLGVILMGGPGAPGPADLALVEDLATRVGLAADNNRYVQELREEQRRKDVFLAMLAHELRNPLAAVSNAHNAIRLGAGDQRAVLDDIIERQTDKLARLVSDLLDVSRIRLGKIALRRQHLDLRRVAERAVDIVAASHPRSQGAVALDLPVGPVWVDADPDRMEQIVYNLLDNAVKYSPGVARVAVSLTIESDEAVLRVRDAGIGISAEFLPEVFELFTQRQAEGGTPASGLGLGLALVKGLVAEHGGSVAAHSEGVGHGSEFTVRLPCSTMLPFEAGRPAAPGTRRHRVLIVEDNDDGREALRLMLLQMGHEVSTASAGEDGVAVALASLPDVALIDVGLPDIDGYEVARRIRGHPSGTRMRLVALTGYGQPADRQQAFDAGFNAHAVKPLPPERLTRILDG